MFGADTPLMMDALQIVALTAAISAGGVMLLLRLKTRESRRKAGSRTLSEIENASFGNGNSEPSNLEQRVRVLERIATDRPVDLAEEIEALRSETAPEKSKQVEGTL